MKNKENFIIKTDTPKKIEFEGIQTTSSGESIEVEYAPYSFSVWLNSVRKQLKKYQS